MSSNIEQVHTDLTGQVALVTGGGRGMGRACAQALATAGAAVAVVARSAAQLADTVASITATGGRAIALTVDVSDRHADEHMTQEVERQLGPIDLLLNNAGIITPLGPVAEVDPEAWWYCQEINVRGPFLCTRMVLPGMCSRRRGRIINVASTAGLMAFANSSAYTLSKTALIRLTEQVALETRAYGLNVFAINPGPVRTAMSAYLMESVEGQQWLSWYRERFDALEVPMEQVVSLVLFLASGRADRLTGRFLSALEDVAQMVAQAEEIEQGELYTLRLRTVQSRGPS
jgi:NAD(P)-dependent dehydrogenase (short-subunit alcohol dehydrogenase family)